MTPKPTSLSGSTSNALTPLDAAAVRVWLNSEPLTAAALAAGSCSSTSGRTRA